MVIAAALIGVGVLMIIMAIKGSAPDALKVLGFSG